MDGEGRAIDREGVAVDGSKVTDEGLVHLKALTELETLELRDANNVTDEGLKHVKGLTNLRWLMLTNTKVTDEGVKNLKEALPNCRIHH